MLPKLAAGSRAAALTIGRALTAAPITPLAAEDLRVDEDVTLVKYRSETIQGLKIAYREAGDPDHPTMLLHGFPTSAHMFRRLLPRIADAWHVIAPDYPGFGASDMPMVEDFDNSFANFARIVAEMIDRKGVERYAADVMDYGAPSAIECSPTIRNA
jgi:hypothetical protein